jgi:N-acetylneuraminic acid mutarotase
MAEANGILYAVGGNEGGAVSSGPTFAYDVANDIWTPRAALPVGRSDPGAGVADSQIYVFGGNDGSGAVTSTYAYTPATDTWTPRAPMLQGRGARFASGAIDGKLYAAGGNASGTTEVYDPATNAWSVVAPMGVPRAYVGGGVIDGMLYVVGGESAAQPGTVLGTLEAYDPVSNTWTTMAPMPTPRLSPAVAVIDGILYVIGGSQHNPGSCDVQLDTVEAYDPSTNTWTSGTSIPGRRGQAAAASSGNTAVVTGGLRQDGCATVFYGDTQAFTVEAPPPVTQDPTADFTATPSPAQAGQPVSFNGSASHDNDAAGCDPGTDAQHCVVSYFWEFGDGTVQTTSGPTTAHTYAAAGAYTATLTVTDNDGRPRASSTWCR